jgi:hypothetical protein
MYQYLNNKIYRLAITGLFLAHCGLQDIFEDSPLKIKSSRRNDTWNRTIISAYFISANRALCTGKF